MRGLTVEQRQPILERLERLYVDDPDSGVHSAIRWILHQHSVGMKFPNAWGAFDTHGSLWEWSTDPANGADRTADQLITDSNAILLHGGAFDNQDSRVRSGNQLVHFPQEFKFSYGFRPARTLFARPEETEKRAHRSTE